MAAPSATFTHLHTTTAPYLHQPTPPTPDTEGLPASARAIYAALAERGPQTHKDPVSTVELPGRTIRWAVNRLRKEGIVGAKLNVRDPRQSFFYLAGGRGEA